MRSEEIAQFVSIAADFTVWIFIRRIHGRPRYLVRVVGTDGTPNEATGLDVRAAADRLLAKIEAKYDHVPWVVYSGVRGLADDVATEGRQL